jgi:squalene synthase HpnC
MRPMTNGFATDLIRYGPDRPAPIVDQASAHVYCGRLARGHYENFTVASVLLPRQLLRHFHAVYGFCRWADDLADEAGGGARALALLRWWRGELLACYGGKPSHPVLVALQDTIAVFDIPPDPFLDLLFAFEQDQLVKRYQTFEQLLAYCRCSANPVGRLVLYLFRSYDQTRAELSDKICTALQLANFWQDVSRDFDIGRVYLPQEDRERFNYSDEDLEARQFSARFADLLRFEVDRTRDLFYRGFPLVDKVPSAVQADVELFIRGGLAVLRKIEAQGYNVWHKRPALAKWEKGTLLAGALWRRLRPALRVW